ncbi:MAG: hypothetical protein M3235_02890 [Actinomycetota bacterium]|nr:hypothetical protein [Actinomycetota bacterium]
MSDEVPVPRTGKPSPDRERRSTWQPWLAIEAVNSRWRHVNCVDLGKRRSALQIGQFDAKIALTFARGQEFDNGSRYALFDGECRERFRVRVNPRAFRGVEFRPQGIVTAYETNWPNFVRWDGGAAGFQSRTACLLFDRIGLHV